MSARWCDNCRLSPTQDLKQPRHWHIEKAECPLCLKEISFNDRWCQYEENLRECICGACAQIRHEQEGSGDKEN